MPQVPYRIYDWVTLKMIAKRADAIVVSSKLEWNEALAFGINSKKLHLIPMGIDCVSGGKNEFTEVSENSPIKILFVGRMARVRRVELLIQAVSCLEFPYFLTIVGGEEKTSSVSKSGYLSELTKLCSDLGIQKQVQFTGQKTPDEIKEYYLTSDIFVYPSLYENFGQPLLEAGAAGLPLVSTPVGVAPEIIEENVSGFLVNDDPKAIAEKIKELRNPKLRSTMGHALQRTIEKNFGWSSLLNRYVDLYQSF